MTRTLSALLAVMMLAAPALGADHSEAPGTRADRLADLADLYVFPRGTSMVTAVTFDGLRNPADGTTGNYDPDVLYRVHLDRDADNQADLTIDIRFGQNGAGDWGVRVDGLPGVTDPVIGPVGSVIEVAEARVFAGLRDDPFFFDLEGFEQTLQTGAVSFQDTRDSVAGLNCTAIVLEFDRAAALGGSQTLNLWTTTGRK